MRFGRVLYRYLAAAVFVFAISNIMPHPAGLVHAKTNIAAEQVGHQQSPEKSANSPAGESAGSNSARPKSRADSVRAVVSHIGLAEGSVIADIGAGNGKDTWVFAGIVGETGKVYAEEIGANMVKSLKDAAKKKGLAQVTPVLGRSDDPCLPRDSIDLVYMNRVYHHFAKPREMLRGLWRSLKPGGHLVIVDQWRGTLRDWVPRYIREKEHHWIAETTVVREAREEGFAFVSCAEEYWYEKVQFVLVFQRPRKLSGPGRSRPISAHFS